MNLLHKRYVLTAAVLLFVTQLGSLTARADELAKPAANADRHVVVVVMDGLRPDSVTPALMPTLTQLAKSGTFFNHHHAVFVSSTEVNGTALATGGHPDSSGIIANKEYRPSIDDRNAFGTEAEAAVRKGDQVSHGHYLSMPTVAELLRADQRKTAVAGTKPVALLFDRGCEGDNSVTVVEGKIVAAQPAATPKGFPKKSDATKAPNSAQDQWTTQRLIAMITRENAPVFSVLWLSEPDFSQHGSGLGSETAKAALKNCDDCLAQVLKALDDAEIRQNTDVLVVSDHGFSTISRTIETAPLLRAAGFNATYRFSDAPPKPGDVLVVGNGSAVSLYVIGHDPATVQRLADFLQASDFAGTIFARQTIAGTFPLTDAHIASGDAPDLLVSLQWSGDINKNGIAGSVLSEGTARGPGQGSHASLSAFDMHNTLIAAGPDFRAGFASDLPSGNIDVAPTVMTLLGYTAAAEKMDGRVLAEAFRNAPTSPLKVVTKTLATEPRTVAGKHWQQWLQITTVGKAIYYDQGTAESKPQP